MVDHEYVVFSVSFRLSSHQSMSSIFRILFLVSRIKFSNVKHMATQKKKTVQSKRYEWLVFVKDLPHQFQSLKYIIMPRLSVNISNL